MTSTISEQTTDPAANADVTGSSATDGIVAGSDIPNTNRATADTAAPSGAPATPGAPVPVRESGAFSITSFVLGIASVTMGWTLVAPIIGLVLGIMGRRSEPGHRALSLWGIILNAVMLTFTVLALVFGLIVLLAVLPFVAIDSVNFS